MKKVTNTYSLLVNQLKNLRATQINKQGFIVSNGVNEYLPFFNLKWVHSSNQPYENADKQERTKLFIKHMVTVRCKIILNAVLEDLGLNHSTVELGEVEIIGNFSDEQRAQLNTELLKYGLELMEDNKQVLVEKIIDAIIEWIHFDDVTHNIKFSYYLSKKLNHSYTYLSNLFSEIKGISVQHYILLHKIERVKELIIYDELTLTQISIDLHYSSVAHLSKQFKDITGMTPSQFKNMECKRRFTIDTI